MGAQDIGSWQHVLWTLSALGVLTNLGLVGVTEQTLTTALPFRLFWVLEINESNKITFLIVLEHLLLLGQIIFIFAIPDRPEDLAISQALHRWRSHAPRASPPPNAKLWDDAALLASFDEPMERCSSFSEVGVDAETHLPAPQHLPLSAPNLDLTQKVTPPGAARAVTFAA